MFIYVCLQRLESDMLKEKPRSKMSKVFMNGEMTIGLKSLDNISTLNTEHEAQSVGSVHRNDLACRANHWAQQICGR